MAISGGGFPETNVAFVGGGERLLAYDLLAPKRLWEDAADCDDVVLMSAELELAAWDLKGIKLWSTFVEPPWEYEVKDSQIELDVMGDKYSFPIKLRPSQRGAGSWPTIPS